MVRVKFLEKLFGNNSSSNNSGSSSTASTSARLTTSSSTAAVAAAASTSRNATTTTSRLNKSTSLNASLSLHRDEQEAAHSSHHHQQQIHVNNKHTCPHHQHHQQQLINRKHHCSSSSQKHDKQAHKSSLSIMLSDLEARDGDGENDDDDEDEQDKRRENAKLNETTTTTSLVFASILNENLVCNCCLELLNNPVTLMCGHSFCQLCLADWFLISNNRRCPVCRQEWYGVPKQNQMLRAIILRLVKCDPTNSLTYNDKLTREQEKKLKLFHQKCAHSTGSSSSNGSSSSTTPNGLAATQEAFYNQNRLDTIRHIRFASQRYLDSLYNFFAGLVVGVLLTSVILMILWLLFGGRGGSGAAVTTNEADKSSSLSSLSPIKDSYLNAGTSGSMSGGGGGVALLRKKFAKPIESWTCHEIQEWLYALGPWTNRIATVAQRLKIDGPRLLELNETNLSESPFDVRDESVRKLFVDSIKILKSCQREAISFWDVKNANRYEFVFFGLFFETSPRLTFIYFYFRDSSFLQYAHLAKTSVYELTETDFVFVENAKKCMLYKDSSMNEASNSIRPSSTTSDETVSASSSSSSALSHLASLVKLPYMRFKQLFNLFFYDSNKFVSIFLSIRCLILTLVDMVFFVDLLRSLIAFDTDRVRLLVRVSFVSYSKTCALIVLVNLFWNFLPNLLVDAFFVYVFFLRVIFNLDTFVILGKSFLESVGYYFIRSSNNN